MENEFVGYVYYLEHSDDSTPEYVKDFLERREVSVSRAIQSPASDKRVILTLPEELRTEDKRDLERRGYSIT